MSLPATAANSNIYQQHFWQPLQAGSQSFNLPFPLWTTHLNKKRERLWLFLMQLLLTIDTLHLEGSLSTNQKENTHAYVWRGMNRYNTHSNKQWVLEILFPMEITLLNNYEDHLRILILSGSSYYPSALCSVVLDCWMLMKKTKQLKYYVYSQCRKREVLWSQHCFLSAFMLSHVGLACE